jgi:hypothetical protein
MIGGFESQQGLGIFLFATVSRTALGPTQTPIQCVQGAISLEGKRPGHEAHHSPLSSAEVKECVELYLHSTNTAPWRGAQLKKAQDNFTLAFMSKGSSNHVSSFQDIRYSKQLIDYRHFGRRRRRRRPGRQLKRQIQT